MKKEVFMITDTFVNGFIASLIAGMITGIGGLCIFLKKRYLKSDINQLLNLAAGVMLAASFFSLLVILLFNTFAHIDKV